MTNELIRKNLTKRKESCLTALNSMSNLDSYLKGVLKNLNKFDFSSYKHNLEKEIFKNLKNGGQTLIKELKKRSSYLPFFFSMTISFRKMWKLLHTELQNGKIVKYKRINLIWVLIMISQQGFMLIQE